MGRKTVLVDDLDGTELPEDTQPIRLSLGRTTYNLYLSEKNHEKLLEAVTPYIENAETVTGTTSASSRTSSTTKASDKERNAKVREWAQSTGFKFTNAAGEEVTLGDRGRIPEAVFKAYDEANA